MDGRGDPAEERDPTDVGARAVVLGDERADRAHAVDAGVGLVGRDDERDGEDAGEAHAEEDPRTRIHPPDQPDTHLGRLLVADVAGQALTHVVNDGPGSRSRERSRGWIRSLAGTSPACRSEP